jgi:ferric-dicitrate binding protein FerR (iron transport regulator)
MNGARHISVRKKVGFIVDSYFGGLNSTTDDRVQRWLLDDRDRDEKDRALRRIWNELIHETEPDRDVSVSLAALRHRLNYDVAPDSARTTPLKRRFSRVAVAASVVLCFAVGVLLFLDRQERIEERVAPLAVVEPVSEVRMTTVSAGERAMVEVDLPDGSKAWIQRHGSITYPENFVSGRTVDMEGRAYFSVVRREGDPFFVNGEGIAVKVLGTEFLVETAHDGAGSVVEVVSGSVEVAVSGETHTIATRERLIYREQLKEVLLSRLLPEEVVAAWKEENLMFKGCALDEVLRRVGICYDVTLAIDESLPVDEQLTVQFPQDESLEEVMDVLSHISGFGYNIENNNVTIYKL